MGEVDASAESPGTAGIRATGRTFGRMLGNQPAVPKRVAFKAKKLLPRFSNNWESPRDLKSLNKKQARSSSRTESEGDPETWSTSSGGLFRGQATDVDPRNRKKLEASSLAESGLSALIL